MSIRKMNGVAVVLLLLVGCQSLGMRNDNKTSSDSEITCLERFENELQNSEDFLHAYILQTVSGDGGQFAIFSKSPDLKTVKLIGFDSMKCLKTVPLKVDEARRVNLVSSIKTIESENQNKDIFAQVFDGVTFEFRHFKRDESKELKLFTKITMANPESHTDKDLAKPYVNLIHAFQALEK